MEWQNSRYKSNIYLFAAVGSRHQKGVLQFTTAPGLCRTNDSFERILFLTLPNYIDVM
jgi:hypothetical protein